MSKKTIKKVKRAKIKVYTDLDKIKMLELHSRDGWSQAQIAEKFGTTRQNVNKILKNLSKNVEIDGDTLVFNSDAVLKRKELSMFERTKLVNNDAIEVVEMCIAIAKYKAEQIFKALQEASTNPENVNVDKIGDLDKVNRLLATALPYVLQRNDVKKVKPEDKKNVARIHKLMEIPGM